MASGPQTCMLWTRTFHTNQTYFTLLFEDYPNLPHDAREQKVIIPEEVRF